MHFLNFSYSKVEVFKSCLTSLGPRFVGGERKQEIEDGHEKGARVANWVTSD